MFITRAIYIKNNSIFVPVTRVTCIYIIRVILKGTFLFYFDFLLLMFSNFKRIS